MVLETLPDAISDLNAIFGQLDAIFQICKENLETESSA